MEFHYKGANCVQLTTKEGVLITDPNLALVGAKQPNMAKASVCLLTDPAFAPTDAGEAFIIDSPGEYEVKGFAIRSGRTRAHIAAEDEKDVSTIYRVSAADLNIAIIGHIYPEISDDHLEMLGVIDVLVLPVGGNGYTLDAVGAAKIVKAIGPKAVIPTHYADPSLHYPVPQAELDLFIKELGVPHEEVDKFKVKKDTLNPSLTVYSLKRS